MKNTWIFLTIAFLAFFNSQNFAQTVPCDSLDPVPKPWGVVKSWVGFYEELKIKALIDTDTCGNGFWSNKKLQEYRFATESMFYRYENTSSGMILTNQYDWKNAEENLRKAEINRKPGGIVIAGGEDIVIDTFSITDQELGWRIVKNCMHKTSWLNDSLEISGIRKFTKRAGLLTMEVSVDYLNTTYIIQGNLSNGMYVGVSWFLPNNGGPVKVGKLWVSAENLEKALEADLFFDFSYDAMGVMQTMGFPKNRPVFSMEHDALVDFFRAVCSN